MDVFSWITTFNFTTAILLGVVTAILYSLFLAPTLPIAQQPPPQPGDGGDITTPQRRGLLPPPQPPLHNNNNYNGTTTTTTNTSFQIPCRRSPPHLLSKAYNNGSNVLNDGLIAFGHTKASASSSSVLLVSPIATTAAGNLITTTTTTTTANTSIIQKRRAQLLSRLLLMVSPPASTTNSTSSHTHTQHQYRPPGKGSTISIAVQANHLQCPHLHEALFLLGTFYNILVIIAINQHQNNDQEQHVTAQPSSSPDALRQQLYDDPTITTATKTTTTTRQPLSAQQQQLPQPQHSYSLTRDIVPPHRILVTSTLAGRVAIVRQIQRVELVLELDIAAQELLARFGHKVIVYGSGSNNNNTKSTTNQSRFAELWEDC